MNTKTKNPTPNPGLMLLNQRVVERAEQRRRIAAAFVWSRIGVVYAGDQKFGETTRQDSEHGQDGQALEPAAPAAARGPRHHGLGSSPELVDIRSLGVMIRESDGRHAKLDPEVAEALSCQAGAR